MLIFYKYKVFNIITSLLSFMIDFMHFCWIKVLISCPKVWQTLKWVGPNCFLGIIWQLLHESCNIYASFCDQHPLFLYFESLTIHKYSTKVVNRQILIFQFSFWRRPRPVKNPQLRSSCALYNAKHNWLPILCVYLHWWIRKSKQVLC